ncbi:MAG: VWA domain-containing protein, partial [Chloroflexi bacterium]|nr:VWA domain-containing protein [Chloroflexota bacterium]
YLQEAYDALKHAKARVKHIILLGDGDATDAGYEALARKIRAGGVTISTVATNGLGFSDFQVMHDIAKWGGGRYYRADNTSSIPKIFLREARTVARSGIITGKFYPQALSANPMLRDLQGVAPLYGYVATTPKPTGEMVLVSKKLDPVLAGWQFGLGRAVAWTSDAAGLWTRDWLQAPGANRFWADLVSWTLPSSQGGHLFISASSAQGQGKIDVDVPSSLGADPGVTARVTGPDARSTTIQLQPVAPRRYAGAFQANAEGPYFVTIEARGAGHAEAGQVGLDVPYSSEYRTSGTNLPFLRALAAAGGGSLIGKPSAAWLDNLSAVYDRRSLQDLLALLALLLLPVDIAVRRLAVGRRDLRAILAALPFAGRSTPGAEPVVAPLKTLRARRAGARPERRPAPAAAAEQAASLRLNVPGRAAPPAQQKAATAAPASEPPAAPVASSDSTSSRLLAAKKRRK